jgi:hypothetical protein
MSLQSIKPDEILLARLTVILPRIRMQEFVALAVMRASEGLVTPYVRAGEGLLVPVRSLVAYESEISR